MDLSSLLTTTNIQKIVLNRKSHPFHRMLFWIQKVLGEVIDLASYRTFSKTPLLRVKGSPTILQMVSLDIKTSYGVIWIAFI